MWVVLGINTDRHPSLPFCGQCEEKTEWGESKLILLCSMLTKPLHCFLILILVCLFCLLWHLEYLVSQLATPCKPWEDQATTSHSSIYWHLIWNWWIFGGNLKASMLRKPSCICYRTNARKHSGFVWIALSLSSSYSYCVCINTETVMRRKTVLGEYGKDVKNPALVFLDSVLICEASLTAHILTYSPRSKKHISVSGPEKQLNVVHLKWVSS